MRSRQSIYEPVSVLERLVGFAAALLAVGALVQAIVRLIVPLLPWLGGLVLIVLMARIWVKKNSIGVRSTGRGRSGGFRGADGAART